MTWPQHNISQTSKTEAPYRGLSNKNKSNHPHNLITLPSQPQQKNRAFLGSYTKPPIQPGRWFISVGTSQFFTVEEFELKIILEFVLIFAFLGFFLLIIATTGTQTPAAHRKQFWLASLCITLPNHFINPFTPAFSLLS